MMGWWSEVGTEAGSGLAIVGIWQHEQEELQIRAVGTKIGWEVTNNNRLAVQSTINRHFDLVFDALNPCAPDANPKSVSSPAEKFRGGPSFLVGATSEQRFLEGASVYIYPPSNPPSASR